MWICSFCGWENYQDDRIARQEPKCVRCDHHRGEMETKIKECEDHLGELSLKLIDAGWRLEHLFEWKESLEGETATAIRSYEDQLEVVNALEEERQEYKNILLKCQPEPYIRGLQENQSSLSGW